MATQWTPAQKLAIDSRDGTLLVSAAAGSGQNRGTGAAYDRPDYRPPIIRVVLTAFLMVTFSRKAAGEMRTPGAQSPFRSFAAGPGEYPAKKNSCFCCSRPKSARYIAFVPNWCGSFPISCRA